MAVWMPSAFAAQSCADAAKAKYGAGDVASASCKPTCTAPEVLISDNNECFYTNPQTKCCVVKKEDAPAKSDAKADPSKSAVNAGSSAVLHDPLGGVGILGVINRLVLTFLGLVGSISLLVFVYAGILYMTAGGAEDQITKAKDTMKYAFIGLVLIMGAYIFTNFYFNVLTQDPPQPKAPPKVQVPQ